MYDFSKLDSYVESLGERFDVPGCSMTVMHNREVVYSRYAGWADAAHTVPSGPNDRFWFYSATKIYTCTAVMQLIERGLLGLHDPVSRYLPEYGELTVRDGDGTIPATEVMTIYHLLTMTGGLNYNLDMPSLKELVARTDDQASTREIARAIAQEPLEFQPGSRFCYSLCHDVLAAVVEAVSGMSFGEYMRINVFEPLGTESLSFDAAFNDAPDMTAKYIYDNEKRTLTVDTHRPWFIISAKHESGGAGMCGRAHDYILLPDAFANGGRAKDGSVILTPESIDMMRTNRMTTDTLRADFLTCKPAEYGFGLGVRTRIKDGANGLSAGEFGWDGAAGTYYLIDPEHNLSLLYCEHILGHYCAYDTIHSRLRDLVYECLAGR